MRATSETGYSLTIPYPQQALDPSEYVAHALMRAMFQSPYSVSRVGDNQWNSEEY